MAIDNVLQVAFTDAEVKMLNDAIITIEKVLKNKVVQLTASDAHHYGKLGKGTEGWASEVYHDIVSNPMLVPSHINAEFWTSNQRAHEILSPLTKKLESITQQMKDTNRVVGYNIVLACNAVYKNAKQLSLQNVVGFKLYYDKWKVQFASRGNRKNKKNTVKEDQRNESRIKN